ncbi:MAG: carbonic anhydrase [Bacteroidetes bacterium]|nr:carbonic anhydrase [Bacteroidota bacterium]
MEKFDQKLLRGNKEWVAQKLSEDSGYFKMLSQPQHPLALWIGCSDSRVPPNEVTRTHPGELFVQRNIANMVVHSDINLLSVLDYSVNILGVTHVIVCGHYGCGGIKAAMSSMTFGLLDNWLRNIKDVYLLHEKELDSISDITERGKRLVELNVREQVRNLCKTSIIQNAWKLQKHPHVHGWVDDISTGLIKDLGITLRSNEEMHKIYKYDFSVPDHL